MKLRPYQQDAITAIFKELRAHKKALAYLSVGAGKTIIMAEICRLAKGTILITVPRVSLIEQTCEKLEKFIPNQIGVYCGSLNRKELDKKVIVSTLQSISKVKDKKFDCIIIDEVHLRESEIKRLLSNISYNFVISMSGTPFMKSNIYGDDKFWNEPCISITMEQLTDMGFLTPLRIGASTPKNKVNLKGLKFAPTGDYFASHLFERYGFLIEAQVQECLEKTHNRKGVIWVCSSIDHANAVYSLLPENEKGITHSEIPTKQDNQTIRDFRNGEIKHLVSVDKVAVGFDVPVADALVLMRPTRSPSLFVQIVGRILRLYEGKDDALLLDFGNVTEELGHPYTITSVDKIQRDSIKACSECDEINPSIAKICSNCGEIFMSMCDFCFTYIPYGTQCCVSEKKERDSIKNLSEKSYNNNWHDISIVSINEHISKAGKKGIKYEYWSNDNVIITVYSAIFPVRRRTDKQFLSALNKLKDNFKAPNRIQLDNDENGYKKIIKREYQKEDIDLSKFDIEMPR